MDPLSVSASISGLISILDLLAGKSYKYVKEVKGSAQEVKNLVNEMTDLYGILNQLRLVVSRFDDESISSTIQFQHIDTCRTLLDRIKERLDKADRDNTSSQKSAIGRKISNLGRALIWPFSIGETRALIDDVTTQKSTLMFALQVDGMNALFDALGDRKTQGLNIEAIRANVLGLRNEKAVSMLNQKQKKIIEWIAPYDTSQRHQEIATKLRQPGTGQGDQFKAWLGEKASKLWLYGIRKHSLHFLNKLAPTRKAVLMLALAGAGKTILISSTISCIFDQLEDGDCLAFFYCDYKDTKTQDPLNILGSLVKQLVLADRRGFAELEACWVNHCPDEDIGISNSISAGHLCELLRDISRHFDNVHLVVDALDECGDGRLDIVRLLTGLNATKDSNIKIILASRPEPDIERYLEGFTKLPIAAHRKDLELYVHSEMEYRVRERKLRVWDQKLKEEITQRLVDGAQGMFRWVTCQFDQLCELNNPKSIRRALHSLPPTLFGTYERILDRVNFSSDETKELVRRVLIWTVSSITPLTLPELLEAVSIDLSDKRMDRDAISDEECVLTRCSSLVRKTEGPFGTQIELAHFSVKEFLLLKIQNDRYAPYRFSEDYQNSYMAKVCLTYLLFEDFQELTPYTAHTETYAMDKKYAFYHYASLYFAHHLCGNSDDEELFELLKLLFDPIKTNNFVSWAQELLYPVYQDDSLQKIIANCNTLHFATLFSFFRVVRWLVSETKILPCLNKEGSITTLLACAVAPEKVLRIVKRAKCMKHLHLIAREVTLEALLQPDIKLDQSHLVMGDWGESPHFNLLELAIRAQFGWEILLRHGALVTESCIEALKAEVGMIGEHGTCFATNFVQMTKLENVPTDVNPSFMQLARQLKCGNTPLLDSFYNSVMDTDSLDEMVVLQTAITFGQTHNVLQVLKKRNTSINSCSNIDGLNALHRASRDGHLEIVKILLDHGALLDLPTSIDGIDTKDASFGLECVTPFHLAVASGHQDVAEFLEERGADINKSNKHGLTPLHSATAQSTRIIEYLLQSPRQRHSSCTATLSGWTVLMGAACSGSFDIFKLVLQNSRPSAVLLQCENEFNCLHLAVSSKLDPCPKVALLRQTCVNPCIPTTAGFLPLHLTVGFEFDIFRETLNFTLDFLTRNNQNASTCKPIISRSLLQGSDSHWSIPNDTQHDEHILNHLTGSGQSILHDIVANRCDRPSDSLKMLKLLLTSSRDVNIEIKDGKGRSPLLALCDWWAGIQAFRVRTMSFPSFFSDAIWLLLRYGAVAAQQDNQGNTAIHYLCKITQFTIYDYRCMTYLLTGRYSRVERTDMAGKIDSAESTRGDDSYGQYDENKYLDECSEEYGDTDAEYNDDEDSFDDCPVIESDSASPEVHITYNDTSNSLLLANKLNITAVHVFFENPKTFYNTESRSFYTEIALLLLSAASMYQLNRTLIRGRRLLQTILELKDDRLALALLDIGVDTVSPDEGTPPRTALEMLCIHGSRNNRVIRRIITNHVDKTTLNADGSTMLHLACIYGQIDIFEQLLHAGWKTDVSNQDGKPLVLQAIESGNTTMVNLLLEHGSILLDKYLYGSTIKFSLSAAQNVMMCQLLHEKGINNWHQEATIGFWGQFIPQISTIKTRYSSPPSSGSTQWLSVAIERVTPLHIASWNGNETVLQYALDCGNNVDINLAASFSTTPLFFAVYGGNIRNIGVLLSRGADVSKSPSKTTLLHLAAARGDELTVRLLLQHGADTQARDYMGRTPTSLAFNLGYKSIVVILKCNLAGSLSSANTFSDSNLLDSESDLVQSKNFVSPLIEEAIRCRDLGTLKSRLQDGDSLEGSCYCGCSPLLVALTLGGKEVSHLLAEAGASLAGVVVCPIPRPTSGFAPLHLAALYGYEQLLEKLIEIGQPKSVQRVHPLHIAAYNGYSACVRILLSHDFDGQCGVDDKTSLAELPCHQEARMLSYNDKDLFIAQDICGTSLHYASLRGHIDVMTELLRFGADLDAQDKSGRTPLHLAAIYGHHQACDLLISTGASVLCRDHENRCPIHYAICEENHRIVEIMIKELAIFDILLEDGGNLLDYACSYSNAETIEILIAAGMNIDSTDNYEWPAVFTAMSNRSLTEEFRIKLLAGADNLYQTPKSESLLIILCSRCLLLATRYLLERLPKEKSQQYVNYVSIYGTALYCTAANSQEQNSKIAELLIDHGAELEVIKPSHSTPLMGACYYGSYEMVVLLLKKGARTTCNKRDGTQMTAVEEARHHPDILYLLKNFEEKGVEALYERRPALLANMVTVEECLNRISEEKEQEDQEKDEKRKEEGEREEKKKEDCEKSDEAEVHESDVFEKDKE